MRFQSLHLIRYGHFTDRLLNLPEPDKNKPDIHIVYGHNEVGKSTISNAILDFLYGIPNRTRYAFLHDSASLEIAATLQQQESSLHLHRLKSVLRDTDSKTVDAAVLDKHNLSREDYQSRFWVDNSTLHKGGESILSSKGELGAALFSATTGLNTLSEQLKQLMIPTDNFFKPRKRTKIRIKVLNAALKDVQKELKTLDSNRTLWDRLQKQLKQQQHSAAITRTNLKDQRASKNQLLSLKGALEKFHQWRVNQIKLNDSRAIADVPEHWYEDVQQHRPEYLALSKNIQLIKSEIASITQELKVHVDLSGWSLHRQELEQLKLSSELFTSEQQKVTQHQQELQEVENEFAPIKHELKSLPITQANECNLISDVSQSPIDENVEAWKALHVAADHLKQERTRTSEKLGQLKPADKLDDANMTGRASTNREPIDKLIRVLEAGEAIELIGAYKQARQLLSDRKQEAYEQKIRITAVGVDDSTDLHQLIAPSVTAIRDCVDARRAALSQIESANEKAQSILTTIDGYDRQLTRLGHSVTDDNASYEETRDELRNAWNDHKDLLHQQASIVELKTQTERVDSCMDALDSSVTRQFSVAENFGTIKSILDSKQDQLDALDKIRRELSDHEQTLESLISEQNKSIEHIPNLSFTDSAELIAWRDALEIWRDADRKRLSQEETVNKLCELCAKQQQNLTQLIHEVNKLTSSADAISPASDEPASLPEILAHAKAVTKLAEQRWQDEHQANLQQHELRQDLKRIDRELAINQDNIESLSTKIQIALKGSWLESISTQAITHHWQTIKRHSQCFARQVQIRNNLTLAQSKLDRITEQTAKLAAALKVVSGDNVALNYQELMTFHDQQQDKYAVQSELKTRANEQTKKLSQLTTEQLSVEQRLTPMHERLGTNTLDELVSALSKVHERHQLVKNQMQIESDVCALQSVDTFEEAWAKLESAIAKPGQITGADSDTDEEPDTADAEHIASAFDLNVRELATVLDQNLTELEIIESNSEASLQKQENELYDTQQQLNQMGLDERVALLRQKEADLMHEIEEGVTDALKMRLGLRAIERGLQHFRDQNRSGMLAKAKASFVALTEDNYIDLVTRPDDKGVEQLIATRQNGASVSADHLSVGTRYQLYLALRIAAYHEYRQHKSALPFIADDIFETFDEPRTRSAITEFSEMALHGQVIYFTHHRHVVDIAREVVPGVNTIELSEHVTT